MNIEVMVEGEGLAEIEVIRIPRGGMAREIVAAVALKSGFPAEEGILFIEDGNDPLDLSLVIVEEAAIGKVHHVHRALHVEVSVHYQNEKKDKQFSPSARVQRVLDWAVGQDAFRIDPAIAPEMELALRGQTTALPKSAHIGRYIRHHDHALVLDLIRGIVPNGDSQ